MSTTETEIVNAEVTDPSIRYDRGVFLTGWVFLNYDTGAQGFGGYVLGTKPGEKARAESANATGLLAAWVNGIMTVCDVDDYAKAHGRPVRVKREARWNGRIIAIGHFTKDIWFEPEMAFAEWTGLSDKAQKDATVVTL